MNRFAARRSLSAIRKAARRQSRSAMSRSAKTILVFGLYLCVLGG